MPIRVLPFLFLLLTPSLLFAQNNPDPARFEAEIEAFRERDDRNTPAGDAILFIGSSSIRMWPTAESFPELRVINRGFGGSHVSHVLHYLPEMLQRYDLSAVVLGAGGNDIGAGKSPERIFDDFKAFVGTVHAMAPGIPVVFIAIKPSYARWHTWPQIAATNELIRNFIESNALLHYADVATPMLLDDGTPDRSLFIEDDLHLNEKGYALWNRTLLPILQSIR